MRHAARIFTNTSMTVILLLLPAYSLLGEEAHEWLGIGIFLLFLIHNILNIRWSRNIFKGKYNAYRILQMILAGLAAVYMLGCTISGVVLSRYALSFLPINGGLSWARVVHMLSSYWGFLFISLHIGLHWGRVINDAKRRLKKPFAPVWIIGAATAGYGVYAFFKRDFPDYLLLRNHFAFFDFNEPVILFILDYAAVMCSFVFIGYYAVKLLKSSRK